MADRAKKANILKIIKNEEIPIVPEVKAVANKSKQTSIKNKDKKDEMTISTVKELSLLPEEERAIVSESARSVNNSKKSTRPSTRCSAPAAPRGSSSSNRRWPPSACAI